MKNLLFLIVLFYGLKVNAQNYLITFTGTGASNNVSNVKVENLTKGTFLTINGSDILRLTGATGINPVKDNQSSKLKIYPNPMTDNSTLEVSPPVTGKAVITVYEMTGKPIAQIQCNLENVRQDYKISGVKNGLYIISIKGNNYQLSGILLSNGKSNSTIKIEKVNSIIQAVDEKAVKTNSKGTLATIDMAYSSGERLKFTGISGNYSTVKIDIPISDKTIAFNFISCTDGDNNNYPVVEIGSQVWMADNLQTTKYNNGDVIGTTPFPTCLCEVEPKYQFTWTNVPGPFEEGRGRHYTWFAVMDSRHVCPAGWHVPTDGEWKTLEMFLGMTQEQVDSSGFRGTDQGAQLKSTKGWNRNGYQGNPNGTNSSGFTALSNGLDNGIGMIDEVASIGIWWSSEPLGNSSKTWVRTLYNTSMKLFRSSSSWGYGGHAVRCLQGKATLLPALTTTAANNIAQTTATSGGNITSDGSATITARGVCWSLSANPTIANNKTFDGTGTGTFTSSITGLSAGTAYYVRAYATNYVGTNYGNEIIINTTISDIDGNVYNTVTIGTQVWMTENLKTTKYRNGDLIGTTTPSTLDIRSESTPKYQWAWNGIESNVATYGRLYTSYAVNDSRNICPAHWHMPTQVDWTSLTDYLGGLTISGGKLKEAGTTHWMSPNTGATNETRFTALPGGYRLSSGAFGGLSSDGLWWSSTESNTNESWTIGLGNTYSAAYGGNNSERSGYSVRCLKGDLPTITTSTFSSITLTTATSGGIVITDGGRMVIARGVCWSTSANPTIENSIGKTTDGTGTGTFISSITGLTANSIYYVRAYATNISGTTYGNELILKTYTGTATDIDGNVYNTVTIGTQIWMVGNLETTKYNDGSSIPLVTGATEWSNVTTHAYCWNNNDPASYKDTYGALYNWYAISTGKLCPTGWHVPADAEWTTLTTYLGGETIAGGKLKEVGTTHWQSLNAGATNESGFTARPGGERVYTGSFAWFGIYGYWWSSTEYNAESAWFLILYNNMSRVDRNHQGEKSAFSVRCLRNN